ncbi:DNA polymerase eta [Trichinella pseudospiralis]|uniref:DNA polymerase eta n=1 Tax=Trichinella pseudospiralis TaxID=6337 RepID=A0A0V1E486_TRIPS|nr:DNA polymerase eta [Trichinella pseudospiralis]KRZ25949.1 DNA polymerase eta [Trichinella pseudospiralis]
MKFEKRIVALIDMDCFYVQVEQRSKPELWGKPVAVVQYNEWRGGGIIAVDYEARHYNVKRGMRGQDALAVCPEIHLVQVPTQRGKADLTKYRKASEEVFHVLSLCEAVVERASIDEAYLDLTAIVKKELLDMKTEGRYIDEDALKDTHLAVKHDSIENIEALISLANSLIRNDIIDENAEEIVLHVIGAALVNKIRKQIFEKTNFHCSAGIAVNKMLAKLACGLNKPKQQTIVLPSSVAEFFSTVPIRKVNWLLELCCGIDRDPVVIRQLPKSIGCSKNFPGRNALRSVNDVRHWTRQLSEELEERLISDKIANCRIAKSLTVGIRTEEKLENEANCHSSRQTFLRDYSAEVISQDAFSLIQEFNTNSAKQSSIWLKPAITMLSMSASRFEDNVDLDSKLITDFFKPASATVLECENQVKDEDFFSNAHDSKPSCSKHMMQLKRVLRGEHDSHRSLPLDVQDAPAEPMLSVIEANEDGCEGGLNILKLEEQSIDVSNEKSNSSCGTEEGRIYVACSSKKENPEPSYDRLIPNNFADISEDVWKELSPRTKWEIKSYYKVKLNRNQSIKSNKRLKGTSKMKTKSIAQLQSSKPDGCGLMKYFSRQGKDT